MNLYCHRSSTLRHLAVQHSANNFVEFDSEDVTQKDTVESIFYGRVQKITGTFALIDIGLDRPGILNNPIHLKEGDKLFLQIKREGVLDKGELGKGSLKKGAQLTRTITLITSYFMYFPYQSGVSVSSSMAGMDGRALLALGEAFIKEHKGKIIFRTKALSLSQSDLLENLNYTIQNWMELSSNPKVGLIKKGRSQLEKLIDNYDTQAIYTDHIDDFHEASSLHHNVQYSQGDVFEGYGVHEAWVEMVGTPWIRLPSGGQLLVEHTSILSSIDVNQGTCTAMKQLNLEAATMIPMLFLKLQLAGHILIDFAGDLSPSFRKILMEILQKNLPKNTIVCAWSPLGFLEIRTPKTRMSLNERFI